MPITLFRRNNTQYLIASGFALGLLLVLFAAVSVLPRMTELSRQLDRIVNEYNVKIDLISTMRDIARDRSLTLYTMAVMDDPFDRDEAAVHFGNLAADFIGARDKFRSLQLTPQEKSIFAEAQQAVRIAADAQDRSLEAILSGDLGQAVRILAREDIPTQKKQMARYAEIFDLFRDESRRAAAEASRAYKETQRFMLVLAGIVIALGTVIAVLVIHKTARIENALFREKELAEITLHSIVDGVITTDAGGDVEYLNPAAEYLTGWSLAEAKGKPLQAVFSIINEATREPILNPGMLGQLSGQAVTVDKHLLVSRDGLELAVENSVSPISDRSGETVGTVVVFNDVTKARELAQQLSWQASHDALTGLANRREFERRLARLLESAKFQGMHHVMLYLDLDRFKIVNDTCGHGAGDELLRQLAMLLNEQTRESDTVARLGGDEFGVLLEGCPVSQGERIAESLRKAIADFRFAWEDRLFQVGASIGGVAVTADSESLGMVLGAADTACYLAKEEGRNRVRIFSGDEEINKGQGDVRWAARISAALAENRFQLYFQSIVPVAPAVAGNKHHEILLRMEDEDGVLVPPMAFIPAAERFNMMTDIDRWVVKRAFDWMVAQPEAAKEDADYYSINLSGQSIGDDDFLAYVVEQFERTGLAPERVCFEITESAAIANLARAKRFIALLKAKGCRFALDDFGIGMSSYAYLRNLDVDFLKIDGAFVRDMADDKVNFSMVEAIHRIGQAMGIRTIAEFIESDAVLEKLRGIGVDYAQGFSIHKPEPLAGTG